MPENKAQITLEAVNKFKDGFSEFDKATKDMSENTRQGGSLMEQAWVGVAAKVTAAYLAFKEAIRILGDMYRALRETASATNDIKTQAEIVGVSAEGWQKWDYSAKMAGASTQGLMVGLRLLSTNINESKKQGTEANLMFKDLGITGTSLQEVFYQLADKFKNAEDGETKVALATKLFGRGSMELIPLLNKGSAAIKDMGEEAKRMGIVLGDDVIKSGSKAEEEFKKVESQLKTFKNNALMPLITDFTTFLDVLNKAVAKFQEWGKEAEKYRKPTAGMEANPPQMRSPGGAFGLDRGATGAPKPIFGEEYYGTEFNPYATGQFAPRIPWENLPPPPRDPAEAAKALQTYYETELKMVQAGMEWINAQKQSLDLEQIRLSLYRQEDSILEGLFKAKLQGIDADKSLIPEERNRQKEAETEVYQQDQVNRGIQRQIELLKQRGVEFTAFQQAQFELFMKQEQTFGGLGIESAKRKYEDFLNLLNQKAKEEEQAMGGPISPVYPDLKKREEQARQVSALELNMSKDVDTMRGNYKGILQAEIELLDVEEQRLKATEGISQTTLNLIAWQKEYKTKELEARRDMDIPMLEIIGVRKYEITLNNQLADQYMNLIPNAIDVFANSVAKLKDGWQAFFQSLIQGFIKLWEDIALTIMRMQMMNALKTFFPSLFPATPSATASANASGGATYPWYGDWGPGFTGAVAPSKAGGGDTYVYISANDTQSFLDALEKGSGKIIRIVSDHQRSSY